MRAGADMERAGVPTPLQEQYYRSTTESVNQKVRDGVEAGTPSCGDREPNKDWTKLR